MKKNKSCDKKANFAYVFRLRIFFKVKEMNQDKNWKGHLCMLAACAAWGLMSPLGKDAMANGISGLCMVTFRMIGAAVCFWLTSLFSKHNEEVPPRDLFMFFLQACWLLYSTNVVLPSDCPSRHRSMPASSQQPCLSSP